MNESVIRVAKARFLILLVCCAAALLALAGWLTIGPGAVSFNVWLLKASGVSESMRRDAVGRLLKHGPDATPSLIAALHEGRPQSPNPFVVETIEGLHDPAAIPSLLELLDSVEHHKDLLVSAIGSCGRQDDAKALVHCLHDKNPVVRATTIAAVRDLAPTRSYFVIMRGLQDPEAIVRYEARFSLEKAFGLTFEADTEMPVTTKFPDAPEFAEWLQNYRRALLKTRNWWMTESSKFPPQLEVGE